MDGVSWSTTRSQEAFSRSTTATTLSRLASFIARADPKQHTPNPRQQPSHLPTYVCGECGKGYSHPADLLEHQELKHMLPKPHRCPSCGKAFSLRSSLQLHRCARESARCERCQGLSLLGSPCPTCRTRSTDPGMLQDASHLRQPHVLDRSPYACAPCGRGFSQKQALLQHQQAGCSSPPSPSSVDHAGCLPDESSPASEGDSTRSDSSDSPGPSSRAASACRFCSRSFRTEDALQRHEQNNHDKEARKERDGKFNGQAKSKKRLLTCRSCDMVFKSTSKLYVHRKEKHSREKNVKREQRPVVVKRRKVGSYPCQICNKVFLHHLSLRAHFRRHATAGNEPSGCATADSKSPENRLNKDKINQVDNKTVRAGPGRPRKEPRGLDGADGPGRPRKEPRGLDGADGPGRPRKEPRGLDGADGPGRPRKEPRGLDGADGPGRPRKEPQGFDSADCSGRTHKEPRGLDGADGLGKSKEVPDVKTEEEDGEFPCPSCAEVFPLQRQLKEHMELHQSSVRRRQCSVCTSEMDTCKWPGSKRQRLYHCVPCQQGFSALDAFLQHCQEHLRVRVEEDGMSGGCTQPAAKA